MTVASEIRKVPVILESGLGKFDRHSRPLFSIPHHLPPPELRPCAHVPHYVRISVDLMAMPIAQTYLAIRDVLASAIYTHWNLRCHEFACVCILYMKPQM